MQGFGTIGRTRGKAVSTTANYLDFLILRMDIGFHNLDVSRKVAGSILNPNLQLKYLIGSVSV